MQTEKHLLVVTAVAATALTPQRFVDFGGSTCAAGERALGVPVHGADVGDVVGVATHGELLVQAGAAVAVGAPVESDAQGRAVPATTGVPCGVARDAAAAAGDLIRVLR